MLAKDLRKENFKMKTNENNLLDGKIEIELKDGILNASIGGDTGILAFLI